MSNKMTEQSFYCTLLLPSSRISQPPGFSLQDKNALAKESQPPTSPGSAPAKRLLVYR